MLTNEMDFLQKPIIQERIKAINQANNETEKQRFLKSLVNDIVVALSDVTVSNIPDDVSVNNLDEVQASLRNELARSNKPILDILSKLKLSTEQQTKVMQDIETRGIERFKKEFQPVFLKRPRDRVEISNLADMPVAEGMSVTNFNDLKPFFDELGQIVDKALKIDVKVPEPKVTVNIPETKIPQSQINIPELDLSEVTDEINRGLKKLRDNNLSNPLFVRLTDLANILSKLDVIAERQKQTVLGFPGAIKVLDVNGLAIDFNQLGTVGNSIGDGSKNVTTAGTRVQLNSTSVPCRYVIIMALASNTDSVIIGGSTVSATSGRPLVALQSEKLDINNLNKVWLDSVVSGEGVQYVYVA